MERKLTFVVAAIIAVLVVAGISVYVAMQPKERLFGASAPRWWNQGLSIESCNGTHVLIRNLWGELLVKNADVYDNQGIKVAEIDFSNQNLANKEVDWIKLKPVVARIDFSNQDITTMEPVFIWLKNVVRHLVQYILKNGTIYPPLSGVYSLTDPDYPSYEFTC